MSGRASARPFRLAQVRKGGWTASRGRSTKAVRTSGIAYGVCRSSIGVAGSDGATDSPQQRAAFSCLITQSSCCIRFEGGPRVCGCDVGPGSRHDSHGQIIADEVAQESERAGEDSRGRVSNLFRLPALHPLAEPLEPPARAGPGSNAPEKRRFEAREVQCAAEEHAKTARADQGLQTPGKLSADGFGPEDHLSRARLRADLMLDQSLRQGAEPRRWRVHVHLASASCCAEASG